MTPTDEHDDDLEPEVDEGAEIETEQFDEADDLETETPASPPEEEPEDESSDTI